MSLTTPKFRPVAPAPVQPAPETQGGATSRPLAKIVHKALEAAEQNATRLDRQGCGQVGRYLLLLAEEREGGLAEALLLLGRVLLALGQARAAMEATGRPPSGDAALHLQMACLSALALVRLELAALEGQER